MIPPLTASYATLLAMQTALRAEERQLQYRCITGCSDEAARAAYAKIEQLAATTLDTMDFAWNAFMQALMTGEPEPQAFAAAEAAVEWRRVERTAGLHRH